MNFKIFKCTPSLNNFIEKSTKLIYSEPETDEESEIELVLENKEVDGINEIMFLCKIDSVDICFI